MNTFAVGGGILITILALAIPLLVILLPVILILGIVKILAGGKSGRKTKEFEAEETRLIQQIHHGLGKMEERIEALETILLEQDRKEGGK